MIDSAVTSAATAPRRQQATGGRADAAGGGQGASAFDGMLEGFDDLQRGEPSPSQAHDRRAVPPSPRKGFSAVSSGGAPGAATSGPVDIVGLAARVATGRGATAQGADTDAPPLAGTDGKTAPKTDDGTLTQAAAALAQAVAPALPAHAAAAGGTGSAAALAAAQDGADGQDETVEGLGDGPAGLAAGGSKTELPELSALLSADRVAGAAAVAPAAVQQVVQALQSLSAAQGSSADPPSAAAGVPGPPRDTAPTLPAGAVLRGNTMTLQLNPEHLGRVAITMKLRGDTMDVRIAVEDGRTLQLLDRDRHLLTAALEGTGRGGALDLAPAAAASAGDGAANTFGGPGPDGRGLSDSSSGRSRSQEDRSPHDSVSDPSHDQADGAAPPQGGSRGDSSLYL